MVWLKQQIFGDGQVHYQDANQLPGSPFPGLLPSGCVYLHDRECISLFFLESHYSHYEGPTIKTSSNPNCLQKASSLILLHQGLRLRFMIWVGRGNVFQSIVHGTESIWKATKRNLLKRNQSLLSLYSSQIAAQ